MGTLTTVHLMRHGEVFNPEGILYGRLPGYELSKRGLSMAEATARFLAGEEPSSGEGAPPRRDITVLIASPLVRAQQSAGACARQLGLELGTDEDLIEADNAFVGHRVDGAFLRKPQQWPKLVNPFKPSWGEPYRVIAARMTAAIDRAREAARGHEALLVSHQLPIWVARLNAEGRRYFHNPNSRQCELASVTSLRFDDDVFVGVDYVSPAQAIIDGDIGPTEPVR